MAEIKLKLVNGLVLEEFPPVCVYCGEAATQTLEFTAKMGSEYGFQTVATRYPICQNDLARSESLHRLLQRIQWILLLAGIPVGLLGLWLIMSSTPGRAIYKVGQIVMGTGIVAVVGVFAVHQLSGMLVGLKVTSIENNVATVTGPCDKFAAALAEYRTRPQAPEQPFWLQGQDDDNQVPFAFVPEPVAEAAPVAELLPEAEEIVTVQPVVPVRSAAPFVFEIAIDLDSRGSLQGSGRAIWNDAGVTLTRPNVPAFFVPRGAGATLMGSRLRILHDQRQIELAVGQGVGDSAALLQDLAAFLRGEGPRRHS